MHVVSGVQNRHTARHALPAPSGSPAAPVAAAAWAGSTFAITILVGAFLLFQIQPLVSKFILPWFGGCPAVWTTCMLFFQIVLLGGYVYAHLLERWLPPRKQIMVHLALVVVALVMLPIGPGAGWKPADSSAPAWRILLLLAATVGLPYFALSATSPLVQAWFSRRLPGRSPYRLYALSNVGSLAALLSYPFLFEPALDLPAQSLAWSGTFVLYALLCGACLACLWRADCGVDVPPAQESRPNACITTGFRHRALWLLLPACASLMLLATTNHVCQDVAVVPFLWVVPLALYLLSFIICFDHQRWYVRSFWAVAAAVTIVAVMGYEDFRWFSLSRSFARELALYFAALFCVCMVCHGELVRLRPEPRRLTEFYLLIAAGGALGGLFVGLLAPAVFSTYFEWEIGLVLSLVLAAAVLCRFVAPPSFRRAWNTTCRAVIVSATALALAGMVRAQWNQTPALERSRNFYSTVTVREYDANNPAEHMRLMRHGSITHGRQFMHPDKRRWPTYTFGEHSGIGQTLRYLNARGKVRVGVVGLGIGTLAAYARPGDEYRFYEINPEVLRLARKHFTYLDDCRGKWDCVLGDGRLSLEREPPQFFDLLVLDAFSGDSVPTHMLTREAFAVYQRHLAPGGVLAVHVTNTYLHLAPVVRGLADDCGLRCVRIYTEGDWERLLYHSDWMLLSRDEGFLRAVRPSLPPDAADDFTVPLWTDHYSNLFQILQGRSP